MKLMNMDQKNEKEDFFEDKKDSIEMKVDLLYYQPPIPIAIFFNINNLL